MTTVRMLVPNNRIAFALCAIMSIFAAPPLNAQSEDGSVAVIQPKPGGEVSRLNSALQRLARDPQSVDALIAAGSAALELGDIDAAIGFFGRADELSPGNPRAKLGMAAGFMRSERPIESLRLFAEAESAGVSSDLLAGDRGLAFDLVGNNSRAQEEYRRALAHNPSDEIARRLALSLAISGNRTDFENVLLPMLRRRELAAYRARAFGLAILGDADAAQQIADAVMPKAMAAEIAPYLRYMPRLTKAQQAASANFGRFPKASDIGRDDPRLMQFARSQAVTARRPDEALVPQGPPLDQRQANQPNLARIVARQAEPAPPAATPSAPEPAPQLGITDAFSSFSLPVADASAGEGNAVDITKIKPPREVVEPPQPSHPSRIWVQVATGRDLNALKFDWRRLSRKAPELLGNFEPHTTPWGQANRLLAGPYPSNAAAREAINALKAAGIDTFSFTSPEGQEIRELR